MTVVDSAVRLANLLRTLDIRYRMRLDEEAKKFS